MPPPLWESPEGPQGIRPWDGWFDDARLNNQNRLQWDVLSDPLGVRDAAGRSAWMAGLWNRPEWAMTPPPQVDFQARDSAGRNLWFYYLDGRGDSEAPGMRSWEVLVDQTDMSSDASGHGWWSVLLSSQAFRTKARLPRVNTMWLDLTEALVTLPGAQEAFWAAPEPQRSARALWMQQRVGETDLDHDNPSFGWEDGKLVPALLLWANTPHATPVEQAAALALGLRGLAHRYFEETGLLALAHAIPMEALDHLPHDFWTLLKMEHRLSQERRWPPAQACWDVLQARQRAHALGESWLPVATPAPKQRF